MSTTKVMMQIIFTFVGYNILLVLICTAPTEGIVFLSEKKKHTSLQGNSRSSNSHNNGYNE